MVLSAVARPHDPDTRAETLNAVFVQLSWLAPGANFSDIDRQAQEVLMLKAMDTLVHQLDHAYSQLSDEEAQSEFLDDLVNAMSPSYCSLLLAQKLIHLKNLPRWMEPTPPLI